MASVRVSCVGFWTAAARAVGVVRRGGGGWGEMEEGWKGVGSGCRLRSEQTAFPGAMLFLLEMTVFLP